MCNHLYEELVPVFDDGGNIECANGVLGCSLLDDASFVLRGWAKYAEGFDLQPDGWHRELQYISVVPTSIEQQPEFDDEIPF